MPENKQAANKTGLTFSEKKRLVELRRILAGNGKEQAKPDTAQKTITFKKMFHDGICQVTHNFYTKMVEFYDINYDLLEVEDQGDILEEYSKLINYFDPSIKFELFLFNRQVNEQAFAEQFDIPLQDDDFDDIREEYTQMLKHQSAKGNNGIIKSKYLIFGVESTGYKEARNKLNNIEKDVIRNLNNIGTNARSLDGKERLRILHEYFNQGTMEPFHFSFKELSESGKSVKDYIAPPGFDFRYPSRFKSGSMYGSVHYLDIIAPRFNDELLKKLLDIDDNLTITMHIASKNAGVLITVGIMAVLLVMIMTSVSSCGAMFAATQSTVLATSYLSEPAEIDATDLQFTRLELDLQNEIDNIETDYPGYDEFSYNLGEIGHNPFTLIGYLSAVHTEFTASEVESEVQALFDEMYTLTLTPDTETRTRTVTKTGTRTVTDPVTGEETEEEYEYEEEEEYEVSILRVVLTVKPLENIVVGKMDAEQTEIYSMYAETGGLLQQFASPLNLYWYNYISSYYGYRKNPNTGNEELHRGVDIAGQQAQPFMQPITVQSRQQLMTAITGIMWSSKKTVILQNMPTWTA